MRKLWLIPLILCILVIIVFLLAGTPLVLDFVKGKIESAVTGTTGMGLVIGRLQGNLFYAAELQDVDLEKAVKIERLKIRYNPLRLLAREVDISSVEVSGLRVDLDRLQGLMARLPKRTGDGGTRPSSLVMNIRRFSMEGSSLSTTAGSIPLSIALATRGSMTQDVLVVDSLSMMTDQSRMKVWGSIPLNEQKELALDYDLVIAVEEAGITDLAGGIRGHGSVRGLFSAIALQSELQLDLRYLENELKGHVAVRWLVPDLGDLNIEAQLSALTSPLRKETSRPDSWNIDLVFRDTNLDCEISSNLGQMKVQGVLAGDFKRPSFNGVAQGNFDYVDFAPSFMGRVQYRNDSLRLSDFALISRRVALDASLLLNAREKKISNVQVVLSCSDLSLWNTFLHAPANMKGALWCNLNASGSLDDPQARAELRITDAEIYGEKIAAADFDLSLHGGVARLDSGFIESPRGRIALGGSFDIRSLDYTGNLYSEGVVFESPETFGTMTMLVGGTVGLDLHGSGNVHKPQCAGEIVVSNFAYDTLQFGSYGLKFQLDDDTLQLSLVSQARNLFLDAGASLHGIFPFSAQLAVRHYVLDDLVTPARGYVTADLSADGALAELGNALYTMQVDTMRFVFEDRLIENVQTVFLNLEDRALDIRSCELAVAGQRLSLQGRLPLDFSSAAMDLSVNSSEIQLSDIRYLLPRDPLISGVLKLGLHVGGRPDALDIDGQLSLTQGRYDVENVRVDSTSALLRFKNGMITIERFSGRMNKGRFRIGGYADVSHALLDSMSLTVALDSIDYTNKDFGSVISSADLVVSGRKDSMRISGEVLVHEGIYDKPLSLQTIIGLLTAVNRPAPQQPEMFRRIYCDVGITVPDSVKIANNVANLALKADLQLKGYLARLNAYGTIAALGEGSIKYLGKKFEIVNAVIQFDDPYKIDPVMDLLATSTVAAADGEYEIYMQLQGTATNWQLELNSNPPLPEQDIVSLILIGQRRPGAVGGMAKEVDLKGKVKDYALDMIRHNIEKTTAQVLGLDEFTIAGDLSEPTTLRIGVEKSIAEGFRLHYSTGIESWELQQIGASYDLTKRISVTTLYDQENRNTSVDLEFHWKIR